MCHWGLSFVLTHRYRKRINGNPPKRQMEEENKEASEGNENGRKPRALWNQRQRDGKTQIER